MNWGDAAMLPGQSCGIRFRQGTREYAGSMPRPRFASDKKARRWNDVYAQDCDRRVAVCLATLTTENDPAKRLRIACGLLSMTNEVRAIKRASIAELRERRWTWRNIGAVFGVNASTAYDQLNRQRPFPKPYKPHVF